MSTIDKLIEQIVDNMQVDTEKYNYFLVRTRKYVSLVKEAAAKLVKAFPEYSELLDIVESHDASKFQEPELTPYIEMTWQNPDFRDKVISNSLSATGQHPNKTEVYFNTILDEVCPNKYKYVGDGSYLIGHKNPDFISVDSDKLIVEFFGDFWHGENRVGKSNIEHENERINHFAKYGYRTLVVWERELQDIAELKKKLVKFNLGAIFKIG